MSEIKQDPTMANTASVPDPLGKLRRMSTTAGVGNYDYVAVNIAAVWAILFGVASSLALLGPYLLAIPVLAFIAAGVALRQISKSNRTETGRLLAWGGVSLAIIFSLIEGGRIYVQQHQDARDRQSIFALVDHFSTEVKSGEYVPAYKLFSPEFHSRVTQQRFTGQMQLLNENPYYGKLESIRSNGYVLFQGGYADQIRLGVTRMEMKFSKQAQPIAQDATFRRHKGAWFIDNISQMFPDQPAKQ